MRKIQHGYYLLEGYDPEEPSRIQIKWTDTDLYLACCDCDLVHKISFKVKGETLLIRIARSESETKKLRGKKK